MIDVSLSSNYTFFLSQRRKVAKFFRFASLRLCKIFLSFQIFGFISLGVICFEIGVAPLPITWWQFVVLRSGLII